MEGQRNFEALKDISEWQNENQEYLKRRLKKRRFIEEKEKERQA